MRIRAGMTPLRPRRLLTLLAVAPLLLVAACLGADGDRAGPTGPPPAEIAITPGDGTGDWRPDEPVRVEAAEGELTDVSVRTADGEKVEGSYGDDNATWAGEWTLSPDTAYEVTATAVNAEGQETIEEASFSTLEPASTIDITSVNAAGGNTYGVGIPIVLRFDKPVYNKKWVEESFEVRASEPITGAWHWMNRQEVHFRPKEYWPTGTDVRLIAHFDGVRAAKNVYGVENVDARFSIGDKRVTEIDARAHQMKVFEDGDLVKTFPISAGKPGYPTTSGTHVIFQRDPDVVMDAATVGISKDDPEYYRIETKWTVKFSFSGLYTHSAPWSAGSHGRANVSHGCINMTPGRAKWYYDFSQVGDLLEVTGTPRDLEWGNGWTDWDIGFDEYLEGSATGEPVKTLTMKGKSRSEGSPTASPSTPASTQPSP